MRSIKNIALILLLELTLYSCKKKEPLVLSIIQKETLVYPSNNAQMHINNLNFSWSGKNGENYLVEIASDSNFSIVIDSLTIDSTHYFSRLQYNPPNDGPGSFPTSGNYVMGSVYYWRVIAQFSPIIMSSTQSFSIIDTRDSIVGNWSGTFNASYWQMPNTNGDTIYQGSVSISKNTDGSIAVGGINFNLYPSTSNDLDFSNGCVSCTGSHGGGDCSYNSSVKTLVFSTGGGGMGSGNTTTFTGAR